jgi:hypothetical protein
LGFDAVIDDPVVLELLRDYGLENISFRDLVMLKRLAMSPTATVKGHFH